MPAGPTGQPFSVRAFLRYKRALIASPCLGCRLARVQGELWRGARRLALAVVAACLSLPAADAMAGFQSIGNLTWVTEQATFTVDDGSAGAIPVVCPSGRHPISGGLYSSGEYNGAAYMRSSYPYASSGAALDGWTAEFGLATADTQTVATRGVCTVEKPKTVDTKKGVDSFVRKAITVRCPGTRHVYGGGVRGGPDIRLISSFPIDSKDHGSKPDDGWKIAVDNLAEHHENARAFASCGKEQPVYQESPPQDSSGHTVLADDCQDGFAIAGGQKVAGGAIGTGIAESGVFDDALEGDSFRRYQASVDDNPGDDQAITLFTVCGEQSDFG